MATILSVDDELNPLILRKLLLESAGHRVLSASSGIETLRILQVEKPDLVLTDHLMPGMTGAELAREIKARYSEMPVIIVTGLHELPAGAAVADLVMHKLERRATLLGNIEKILHREAVSSDEATGSSSSADPASN